jgi:hypothetical protein
VGFPCAGAQVIERNRASAMVGAGSSVGPLGGAHKNRRARALLRARQCPDASTLDGHPGASKSVNECMFHHGTGKFPHLAGL